MERLQKILAQAGIASRRGAEEMIRQGRVKVNGTVVTNMGCKIDPQQDQVSFDNAPIRLEEKLYILLNKPAGYVTTLSDPQGRPIVSDLLPGISSRLFPVGRLDLDTEGALLMTNDGQLGNYVLHPSYEVNKTYEATVRGLPSPATLRRLAAGIRLEGGMTYPAQLRILKQFKDRTRVEIIIHEGKKRQVRKMFQAVGHPVLGLKRTAYGRLRLGNLASGKYRILTKNDLKKLFTGKIPFTIKNIPA
ncbi:pseudouridine synthase [Desulfogranum mediterraneum]|uniref:pseudouridine synthase n=1 Tax=Desulfogranum mediterraneum TaxID=160661 RepID=UPI00041E3CC4|nr:pseudouridine synthase [Desulfogranum mediterraneum]